MILVTGGTGFVGSQVIKELLSASFKVRCLARRPPRGQPPQYQFAAGDVTRISTVLAAITPEIEAVVHLVGILAEPRGSSYRAVHVEGTRNVVDACRGMGVQRLVHMSALGARRDAPSEYYRTKWEAEEIVRASGLRYTIMRPSVIFGPGDRLTTLFASMARLSPVVPVPGGGRSIVQPVWVGDVAKAFAMALAREDALDKTLELGGPEALSFRELIDMAASASAGRRRMKASVPMPLMRLYALMLEAFLPNPPVSREALRMLSEDNTTQSNALASFFGIRPTALSEALPGYIH